jgi:hypothetical protein
VDDKTDGSRETIVLGNEPLFCPVIVNLIVVGFFCKMLERQKHLALHNEMSGLKNGDIEQFSSEISGFVTANANNEARLIFGNRMKNKRPTSVFDFIPQNE